MPLSELQFNLGTVEDPFVLLDRVKQFLVCNSEFAYSTAEVAAELSLEPETADAVLVELTMERVIQARDYKGVTHFRYTGEAPKD